jgi:hypothetical protein
MPIQLSIQWGLGAHFPGGEDSLAVKLTTNFHLLLRSGMVELYLDSSIRLCGIVLKHTDFTVDVT